MLSVNGDSCAQGSRLPLRKYYLDIASEFTVHTDDRGVMLGDLAAAHRHAVSVIWNCMRFDLRSRTGEAGTSRLPTTPAEPRLSFFFRSVHTVHPGETLTWASVAAVTIRRAAPRLDPAGWK